MDKRPATASQGEELGQLARLLFDSASTKWYLALGLQIGSGLTAAFFSVMNLPNARQLVIAMLVTMVTGATYCLRLWFSQLYSLAETLRRQSVLAEALNWHLNKTQMSVWRQQAGERVRKRVRTQPREPGYYATEQPPGAARLAEMTIESAFYTRYQYGKLRSWLWLIFVCATVTACALMVIGLSGAAPATFSSILAKVLYALVPVALAVDLLGWAIKLSRITSSLQAIEAGLEQLVEDGNLDTPLVMRYVAEYNCQLVAGLPIPNALFRRWHDEIREHWEQRG